VNSLIFKSAKVLRTGSGDAALATLAKVGQVARRGLPVTSPIRDLLDIIAADKLTTAILDDGP
jgi:hypothetical protein